MKHIIITFTLLIVNVCLHAHPPWGMVVDNKRNIYFPDILRNGGTIWKLSHDKKLISLAEGVHSHNVVLDNDGHPIFAHGENNHTMMRLMDNGTLDTLFHTLNLDEFFGGNCTWSERHGIIYGLKKNKTLNCIREDGSRHSLSNHEFEWNQVIYSDPEGIIYAPDIAVGNGSLFKIDLQGHTSLVAENLISKLDRPKDKHNDVLLGITKGCDSKIYIAELAGQRIIKIHDDGSLEDFYRSEGNWFPCALDFFAGDAYIMEYTFDKAGIKGPQIIKISESGKKTVLLNMASEFTVHQSNKRSAAEGKAPFKPILTILVTVFVVFLISLKLSK